MGELVSKITIYRVVSHVNGKYEWIYQSFHFKESYYWYMDNYWEYDSNLYLQEFIIETYEIECQSMRMIK